jgi:type VI secretion system secreted protein VgrG
MTRTGFSLVAGVAFAALLCGPTPALAQTAPPLGSTTSFAVLGSSTVTSTGATSLTGDLGLSPGTSVIGFPPGIYSGTLHVADGVAGTAQTDLTAAYTNLAGQPCTQNLTGQNLGGLTLTPGVYCFSTSAQLTGTLTLNAQGNSAAVFIFQIGSTLTTATNSSVVVINAASLCNIFWQVGSSATLGTTTSFAGNILAQVSVTLNTGANATGRLLARTGAVTLDTNTVTTACTAGTAPVPTLPQWAAALLAAGLLALGYRRLRRRSAGGARTA